MAQDPVVSANVIFDILNEPDSYGLTWDGTQLDGQGLGYWYHQVMAMGYSINPGAFTSLVCCSHLRHVELTAACQHPPNSFTASVADRPA